MRDDDLDRSCVKRCLAGDTEAFGELVERYERPVFNVILHMVGNYEDARELCQQVFMKSFEHLASFDHSRKFFSWIYRVAVNESINHLKARRPHEPLDEQLPAPPTASDFEYAGARDDIRKAVVALGPVYGAVVILCHFLSLSYREAADVLQIPEKTVKSRLFTARQMLRQALEAKGYAGH